MEDEAALLRAVEDLRTRLTADPPPPPAEVRRALDRIAAMAIALYGTKARSPHD